MMPVGLVKAVFFSSICIAVNSVKSGLLFKIVSTYTSCYSGVLSPGTYCAAKPFQIRSEASTFVFTDPTISS